MLASIQQIISVEPIPNADFIETVGVLGWKVVCKKGEFKVGDLCVYIQIDTLLPRTKWSEFLFKDKNSTKFRLRTIKLKGQVSQGLVLPVSILELYVSHFDIYEDHLEFTDGTGDWKIARIGDDLTEFLKIEKYEKEIPANLRGTVKGTFPSFLHKTDEERIQNDPSLLDKLRGKPYYITTKLDGTSATYYKYNGVFGCCSRNLDMKEDSENVYWQMANKYHIKDWLPENKAIQGEICGPGIQKNPLGLDECDLFLFNHFDIYYQLYKEMFGVGWKKQITRPYADISYVPIEEYGDSFNYTLEELLEKAKGNYVGTNHRKEGIVVRSIDQSISFKVINNDYLLKDEE